MFEARSDVDSRRVYLKSSSSCPSASDICRIGRSYTRSYADLCVSMVTVYRFMDCVTQKWMNSAQVPSAQCILGVTAFIAPCEVS
ncbi:E3 ubiquitin-protein ligase RNF183 isoform X2 [Ranitomeya imitator]|uniref:E3 ubiquitin-protein ligase RNF183 isoform X2 n=1 Tax=Ranitomeya imitator TaxID=111125 RepID=UPI0037E8D235